MAVSFHRSDRRHHGWAGFVSVLGLAAVLLGACGLTQPYVYDTAAYNREDPNFAKTPKTRSHVTVCYSKYGTKQAEVVRLAAETCGLYGAGVQFVSNSYVQCPMATPVGATFACVGAKGSIAVNAGGSLGGSGRASAGTPGQPGAPTAGFQAGARPMGILFGRSADGSTQPSGPLPAAPPAAPIVPAAQQ